MTSWLLGSTLAWAGSMRATVEIGSEGPQLLEVVDAQGVVLATAPVPDARHRSVIDAEGGGASTSLASATIAVEVPWPPGAVSVRTADGRPVRPLRASDLRAAGPGLVPILQSGPPAERLDLVILGDGYTADQLGDFADDADRVVDYLLSIPPYGAYSDLFNVWRIDRASAESGIDHPSQSERVDTAYDCAYDCAGIDRLVCCDDDLVVGTVEDALAGADGILVLLNDPEYGGSGGFNYATAYVGEPSGLEVASHELGHSLIGLWDEYDYGVSGPGPGPNCAEEATGHWDAWLGEKGVASFPACAFSNLYRPTDEGCMMRTLEEGYCPICREQTVLEMYRRLPGIVTQVDPPPGETLRVRQGDDAAPIVVDTTIPRDRLAFEWSLDGQVVLDDEPDLDLRCSGLEGELTLRVYDPTKWVRSDPGGLMSEEVGPWTVSAPPCQTTGEPIACGCSSPVSRPPPALRTLLALRRR